MATRSADEIRACLMSGKNGSREETGRCLEGLVRLLDDDDALTALLAKNPQADDSNCARRSAPRAGKAG